MADPVSLISVFLLDDHDVVRRGVAQLIADQPDMTVVGESATASDAVERVLRTRPRVALLDISLADGNGVEVCRAITAESDGTACVMLTSVVDDRALIEAADAGAAGFCGKSLRSGELLETIRLVAGGARTLDALELRMARRRLESEGIVAVDSLTSQERVIFDLIGRGLSNREISDEMSLAEKTVKNYVANMFSKLDVSRRAEIAAMAARLDERESRWRT